MPDYLVVSPPAFADDCLDYICLEHRVPVDSKLALALHIPFVFTLSHGDESAMHHTERVVGSFPEAPSIRIASFDLFGLFAISVPCQLRPTRTLKTKSFSSQ